VKQKRIKTFALLAAFAAVLSLAGCAKKVAKVTLPPPPAQAPGRTDSHSRGQPQCDSAGTGDRPGVANQQRQ
jgi:predicted small lipoprotein YifL